MKKIIYVGDDGYMVLGTVSASTKFSNDELKQQYGLADTILRNKDELYIYPAFVDSLDPCCFQFTSTNKNIATYFGKAPKQDTIKKWILK